MKLPARVGVISVDPELLAKLIYFPPGVRIVGCGWLPGAVQIIIENLEFEEVQPGDEIPGYEARAYYRWDWARIKPQNLPEAADG
jgi:hypothetical protein